MSWKEFFLTAKGYHNKMWREWEHTRFLGYSVERTIPRKTKMPSITKWLPLPIDKNTVDKSSLINALERTKKNLRNE